MENITFENEYQIINMGGPWIGDLIIKQKKIEEYIIIDNFLEKEDFYYFIRYFEVSKKQKDNYFSVLRVNKESLEIRTSHERFDKIYIENIEDNTLYFCKGFHNQLPVDNIQLTF